jgi:hypothetical protein
VSISAGQGPAPPSLEEQLEAQYKLAHVSGHAGGRAITDPGTVLTIQKGGILGVVPIKLAMCPAKYQDGVLHPPNSFCANMAKNARSFQIGEKVYATKIEVVPKDEKISIKIVACDSCNGNNPPTFYKSQVDFVFAPGSLEAGDVSKIEDTIGEVLAIDASAADQPQAPPGGPQVEQPVPVQPPPAPAAPATIQLGQTIDQVVNVLGQPDKRVDLGAKQIYVYKDLKITFVDGKVSDVQ